MFKIQNKLLILILFTVLLSLLFVMAGIILQVKKDNLSAVKERIENTFGIFELRFYKRYKPYLTKKTEKISTNKNIIHALKYINKNQENSKDKTAILDKEKKRMLEQVSDLVTFEYYQSIAIFEKKGFLTALSMTVNNKTINSIVTYKDSKPEIFTYDSQEIPDNHQNPILLEERDRVDNNIYFTYEDNGDLCMEKTEVIKDIDQTEGFVKIRTCQSQKQTDKLVSFTGNDLFLFTEEKAGKALAELGLQTIDPLKDALTLSVQHKPHGSQEHIPVYSHKYYSFVHTITLKNNQLLYIVVSADKSHIDQTILDTIKIIFIVLFITAFLALILARIFTQKILKRPIDILKRGIKKFENGNFEHKINVETKDEFSLLAHTMNTMAEIIGERETRLRNILNAIPDAIFQADQQMNVLWANTKAHAMGHMVMGEPCYSVFWGREKKCENCPCQDVLENGKVIEATVQGTLTGDNVPRCFEISAVPLYETLGKVNGFVEIAKDVTEQVEAEEEKIRLTEQLQQAQKMESVGRLAGGVAHDFNNILSAINGYAELCLLKMKEDNPFREDIRIILESGQRASRLTEQLLAFSRKQIIRPESLDVNKEIDNTNMMLGRLLGEDVEIEIIQNKDLWPVKMDRSQLEQVMINLAVNSRDAMPLGGKLTIETSNVTLDEQYMQSHYNVTPGDYVMLAISDNGQGMSREIKDNIFEPFFTTKKLGKGTGLGLATVYGIVKQNSGEILVYSEPEQGTIFKIYLPRAEEIIEENKVDPQREDNSLSRGTEIIMLVEDDETVRKMCVNILTDLDYTVLEAENGEDALRICSRFHGNVDLLLTDVVMPKMSGTQLATQMQELCPKMKVIFMSGYTENAIVKHGILADGVNFLHKPVTPKSLSRTVRKILD